MIKAGDYKFSSYQGMSSLEPQEINPNYIGGGFAAKDLSMGTDARTANIMQEISSKINMGIKNLELSQVSSEVFESIPKDQFREVNRLAKLTGTEMTLHAPVVEPSGIGQQGFDESQRKAVERQMMNAIERAKDLNPKKSAPVTFHASGAIPGTSWKMEKGKKIHDTLMVVERESGKIHPIQGTMQFIPGGKVREEDYTPERRLRSMNNTKWENEIFQIEVNRENAERIMHGLSNVAVGRYLDYMQKRLQDKDLLPGEIQQFRKISSASQFIEQAKMAAESTFSKTYELAKKDSEKNEEKKKILKKLDEISKQYGKISGVDNGEIVNPALAWNPVAQVEAIHVLTSNLDQLRKMRELPDPYIKLEEFAKEKSADTFSNVALTSWKKFKDNAPIISIENPPSGGAFASGEDLRELIKESRKKFVEKAVASNTLSKKDAEKQAKKLIGATWDLGHINMLRKQGFGKKELIEESGKIAPFVKHIHLSDNFGIEHTELPMGMGNTPTKEILEKMGQEGYEGKKVIEAIHWWQHFKTPPLQPVMENFGTPMYTPGVNPTTWSDSYGLNEGYFGGYGLMLPDTHFQTWGAGFAQIPMEIGGQMPGGRGSRMSGRPME